MTTCRVQLPQVMAVDQAKRERTPALASPRQALEHDLPLGLPLTLILIPQEELPPGTGLGAQCRVRRAPCDTTADWPQLSGTGRKGERLLRGGVDVCGYRPPSPNASPTAVIPAVSAKAKLKITSAAPASM